MKNLLININGAQFFIKCGSYSVTQLPNGLTGFVANSESYQPVAQAMSTSITVIDPAVLLTPAEMQALQQAAEARTAPTFDEPVPMCEPAPDFEFIEEPRRVDPAPAVAAPTSDLDTPF